MQTRIDRYEALDGLRGVAAIMVIFYHYSLPFFDPVQVFSDQFFVNTSYAFVDLFFVLSGFVIAANYKDRINNWSDFKIYLAKRFARLYPLLLFTVLIYMGLKAYAILSGFSFDTPNYGWGDYLIDVLEPLTFLNSTTLISSSIGMNPPSWSISAEMIAYIAFGFLMLISKKAILPFYLIMAFCIAFIWSKGQFMFAGDYGFVRGLLGFSVGVVAFSHKILKMKMRAPIHEWIFVTLLVMVFFFIDKSDTELTNLLLVPLYFYGILVFSNESGAISRLLKMKIFQHLGKISYSIYLMHFVILWVYYKLVWDVLAIKPSQFMGYLGIFLVLIVVFVVSRFTYQWIERPGMYYLREKMKAND